MHGHIGPTKHCSALSIDIPYADDTSMLTMFDGVPAAMSTIDSCRTRKALQIFASLTNAASRTRRAHTTTNLRIAQPCRTIHRLEVTMEAAEFEGFVAHQHPPTPRKPIRAATSLAALAPPPAPPPCHRLVGKLGTTRAAGTRRGRRRSPRAPAPGLTTR